MNVLPAVRTTRRPFLFAAGLTPLLLSVAIGNAYAADVTITGQKGVDGVAGATSAAPGTDGGQGASVSRVLGVNIDASNRLVLTGGTGGRGGKGGVAQRDMGGFFLDINSSAAGVGGNGGDANGAVRTISGLLNGVADARVVGGNAGAPGAAEGEYTPDSFPNDGKVAGRGGRADSAASAIAIGAASVLSQASAVGGDGSQGRSGFYFAAGEGGAGGGAQSQAYGRSDTGNVVVNASATGGNGGPIAADGLSALTRNGAGAGVTLNNAVSGATRGELTLSQQAFGGSGGSGGDVRSTLTVSDARAAVLRANVTAVGGAADAAQVTGNAGNASAALTLESTRAGTNLDGTVVATGGANVGGAYDQSFFDPAQNGYSGTAQAVGVLRGRGNVTGSATATGGEAFNTPGSAGATVADLTLVAAGLATGNASAIGGVGGSNAQRSGYQDHATATLVMSGKGAVGNAYAKGSGATSTVSTVTSGALAVDVVSRAEGFTAQPVGVMSSLVSATTTVKVAPGGGKAAVNAAARAEGGPDFAAAQATVRVVSTGAIVGASYAKGGYLTMCCTASAATSTSSAMGETSGKHNVTLTSTALSNVASGGQRADYGNATATGYGRSGSGVVDVRSEARGGIVGSTVEARATSVTTEKGGVSKALATASGTDVKVAATALALGARGNVGFGATASGSYVDGAVASSASEFSQSALTVPAAGGASATSVAMAAPDAQTASALTANAAGLNLVGAGMQAVGGSALFDGQPVVQTTSNSFQFESGAGAHVLLAFLSGGGSGFDLMISNHGVELFSRSFTSGVDAGLFFTNNLLDLGVFAAGAQDLLVQSSLSVTGQNYGFNYLVGTSFGAGGKDGVSAVPEASTWLMMMIGMGGMLLVVRRRGAAADARA